MPALPLLDCCAAVMTLSASSPPLSDLVVLWDYLLAGGVHLNVYCITAFVRAAVAFARNLTPPLQTIDAEPRHVVVVAQFGASVGQGLAAIAAG